MKILLIGDDPNIQELISHGLKPLKFEVVGAKDSAEGLRLLDTQKMDLIILDHTSLSLSGPEFVKRVRQISSLPILLISDKHDQTDWDNLDGLSGLEHIQKSFTDALVQPAV